LEAPISGLKSGLFPAELVALSFEAAIASGAALFIEIQAASIAASRKAVANTPAPTTAPTMALF